jgi:hypothetical protein
MPGRFVNRRGCSPATSRRLSEPWQSALKGGPWPVFMIGQVDGGLPEAGEVCGGEVLWRAQRQDLKGEVLSLFDLSR